MDIEMGIWKIQHILWIFDKDKRTDIGTDIERCRNRYIAIGKDINLHIDRDIDINR